MHRKREKHRESIAGGHKEDEELEKEARVLEEFKEEEEEKKRWGTSMDCEYKL